MDNVVYVLGAGFSAPLGLPVMRNFLLKSKDMFAEQPIKYEHFGQVFELIREMSTVKNYFEANLFNVEEILSIVEMRARIGQQSDADVTRYISDVIRHFTPEPFQVLPEGYRGNWHTHLGVDHGRWSPYVAFALCLLGVSIKQREISNLQGPSIFEYSALPLQKPKARYSVITLNYDLVLETVSAQMKARLQDRWKSAFRTDFSKPPQADLNTVPLAKLHGSVNTNSIIAPTWNKAVSKDMESTWQRAHQLLQEANQIRFIGYSLPEADAYIRYLLKSAIINSQHLKNIDVIGPNMKGPNGSNYRSFITFYDARYASATFQDYGGRLVQHLLSAQPPMPKHGDSVYSFDYLEWAHEEVMKSHADK